jgi:hypothetical protein
VFSFDLPVPATFRRDDQAPRVLSNFERILQGLGARTQRRGTTLEFTGGLLARRGGNGCISWQEATESHGPHFVFKASIWREVAMLLVLSAIVGPPLCWGGRLSLDATIRWLSVGTGLLGATLIVVAGLQAVWLRGRMARAIAQVAG